MKNKTNLPTSENQSYNLIKNSRTLIFSVSLASKNINKQQNEVLRFIYTRHLYRGEYFNKL